MTNGNTGEGGSPVPPSENIMKALERVLSAYEIQVLAIMGLLIGSICIFFVKILDMTNIYTGVFGIGLATLLLLLLDQQRRLLSFDWWLRAVIVALICLVLTSPQLYFAWTVSVSEKVSAAQADFDRQVAQHAAHQVEPAVTINNPTGTR